MNQRCVKCSSITLNNDWDYCTECIRKVWDKVKRKTITQDKSQLEEGGVFFKNG